jgi:hypothetical protein
VTLPLAYLDNLAFAEYNSLVVPVVLLIIFLAAEMGKPFLSIRWPDGGNRT